MTNKVRENRLRRMAERQDMRLVKSRRRDSLAADFDCWGLFDPKGNSEFGVESRAGSHRMTASLDEIEKFLTGRGLAKVG
jgi:hypothetical protein